MIEITGSYKGRKFTKEEILSAPEIAGIFGVLLPTERKHGIIRVSDNRTFTDHHGQKHSPASTTNPSFFQISDGDGSFTFRYYTSILPAPNGIGNTYVPNKVSLFGEMQLFGPEKMELFLFWSLHPSNSASPFYRNEVPALVVNYDPEIEAKIINDREEFKANLVLEVSRADARSLRVKAAGIVINGQTVDIAPTISEESIRRQLIRLSQENANDFYDQWNSDITKFNGLISVCVAQSVIVRNPAASSGGQFAWFWNDGTKIVDIARNEEPVEALRRAIGVQYAFASQKMVDALGGDLALPGFAEKAIDIRKAKDLHPSEMVAEQLVGAAVSRDIVGIDRLRKEVKWVDVEGSFEGAAKLTVASVKAWQEELAVFLDTEEGKDFRGSIVKRLSKSFKDEEAKTKK